MMGQLLNSAKRYVRVLLQAFGRPGGTRKVSWLLETVQLSGKNVGREEGGGSLLKTDVLIRRRTSYSSLNHNEFQNFI